MRLGTVVGFQNPSPWSRPWTEVYSSTLAFIETAERVGLDEVWLTEHHFASDGYCPALLPVAAAIAARTTRIRIGTKLILAPFHDPVRLAEDVAVVDIISGGRLDVGLGAGYRVEEFNGFAVDPTERGSRLDECIEVLGAALNGRSVHFVGRHHRFGDVRIMPPPVQRPVPLWLGGRSRRAMRRAIELGAHVQLADFRLEAVRQDWRTLTEEMAAAGRDPASIRVDAVASVFVDRDARRARRVAGPHLVYQQNQYERWFAGSSDRASDAGRQAQTIDDLGEAMALVGEPDEVADRILAVQAEVPFTDLSFWTLLPGLDADEAERSLGLFATDVMPRLQGRDKPSPDQRIEEGEP